MRRDPQDVASCHAGTAPTRHRQFLPSFRRPTVDDRETSVRPTRFADSASFLNARVPFPSKRPKTELKKSLSAAFAQFGKVIDINCAKTYKLRGQAWVVFDTVTAATNAVKHMNEFPFYDKPMRVSYARSKSDATAKAEGTFDPAARDPAVRQKRKAESQAREKQSQVAKKANGREGGAGPESAAGAEATTPPNAILFVQGLPGTSFAIFFSLAAKSADAKRLATGSARARDVRRAVR